MAKRTTRADGRYQGKIYVGGGKYRYVYGKTQKEVNAKLAELRVELGRGSDLSQKTTLSYWTDRWLQAIAPDEPDAWYDLLSKRARFWAEELGDKDVAKILPADLEAVLLSLKKRNPKTGKPSSKKTLTEYRNLIRRIFAYIASNRAITFNPASDIPVPAKAPVCRRHAYETVVVDDIASTPGECQLPCLIMAYAGLRLGELVVLTWSDVDLDRRTISVNKSYDFKLHRVKAPKTAAGTRTVPIPQPLLAVLTAAKRTSLLVCPHNGGQYTRGSWDNALARYARSLPGSPSISAHCLRHTCCTMYYEAGIDVLTAQKWMGHADASTTMKIYTHLREQHEASNVTKLDAFFTKWVSDGCHKVL